MVLELCLCSYTVKPPIKDTPKEDKPNKGQAKSTLAYTLCRKSPLKEDNLSTNPKGVLINRFHCTLTAAMKFSSCH